MNILYFTQERNTLRDLVNTTKVVGGSTVGIALTAVFGALLALPFYLTKKYSSDRHIYERTPYRRHYE